jgi:hypothetical protein
MAMKKIKVIAISIKLQDHARILGRNKRYLLPHPASANSKRLITAFTRKHFQSP